MRRSSLKSAFVAMILTVSLMLVGVVPVSAATPISGDPAGGSSTQSSTQMTPQQWATIKADLNASSLPRTVTVSGGIRTFTYTLPSGSSLVLSEPVGPQPGVPAEVTSQLGVGVCGFFNVCVYLNRTDQGALAAGGAAFLAIAICAIPAVGWISCAAVTSALVVAAFYIAAYGFCPRDLQVGLIPPGSDVRCV